MAKESVLLKGKLVRLSPAALKIARMHYGATDDKPNSMTTPLELLRLPKLKPQVKVDIIPKVEIKPPEFIPITPVKEVPVVNDPVKTLLVGGVIPPVNEIPPVPKEVKEIPVKEVKKAVKRTAKKK